VFGQKTQILLSQNIAIDALMAHMSDDADISAIMKGVIGIQYDPSYSVQHTTEGRAFIDRWRSQPSTTARLDAHGVMRCNMDMDDASSTFLYTTSHRAEANCGGFDFSLFNENGSDLAPFVAQTYDATILMARTIHSVLDTFGLDTQVDALNIINTIIWNVTFEGPSGLVDIFEGMPLYGRYGRGNREVGCTYKLINFNSDAYAALPPSSRKKTSLTSDSFVSVGLWNLESGVSLSGAPIVYRTESNDPVLDRSPDISVELSPSTQSFLIALGSISLAYTFILLCIIVHQRKEKYIRASQVKLMLVILVGGLLSSARAIIGGLSITDETCTAALWCGHIGFLLVFVTLTMKSYRLHRLMGTLKRLRFSENQAVVSCLAIVLFGVLYLIGMTSVANIHASSNATVESNRKTRLLKCSMDLPEIHTTLYVFEAVLLLTGFYYAYKTKDAPDSVNEAKFISGASALITIVCALVFPVLFLISGLTPATKQLMDSMAIGLVTIAVMSIIFIPKIQFVLTLPATSSWAGRVMNSVISSTHDPADHEKDKSNSQVVSSKVSNIITNKSGHSMDSLPAPSRFSASIHPYQPSRSEEDHVTHIGLGA
jgi:hypothetical protein